MIFIGTKREWFCCRNRLKKSSWRHHFNCIIWLWKQSKLLSTMKSFLSYLVSIKTCGLLLDIVGSKGSLIYMAGLILSMMVNLLQNYQSTMPIHLLYKLSPFKCKNHGSKEIDKILKIFSINLYIKKLFVLYYLNCLSNVKDLPQFLQVKMMRAFKLYFG